MDDRQIDALVPLILQNAGLGKPSTIERLRGGIANHVYRVNGEWVVRIGSGSDGPRFPKAAGVLQAVAGRVKAPQVIYTDFTRTRFPYEVMVCSYIEGRLLSNMWPGLAAAERQRYVIAVTEELAKVHAVPSRGLSCFRNRPWAPSVQHGLARYLTLARECDCAASDRLDRMEAFASANEWSLWNAPPDVVNHNDAHWKNVLVHEGQFAGIVDFDDAEVAPAEADHWSLVFAATELDDRTTPAEAMRWIGEACPSAFRHPGCRERFMIRRVLEILWNLTEAKDASWMTPEAAERAAADAYEKVFKTGYYECWFEGI